MKYLLSFRMQSAGGAVRSPELLTKNLEQLKQSSRIAFITHGYNVNEYDGRYALSRLAAIMNQHLPDLAVVQVIWPGDNFLRGLAYPFKGRTADDTATKLAAFIQHHDLHRKELNFISHSLGARVVLETIKQLGSVRVNQVCLLAAAVDDSALLKAAQFQEPLSRIRRVTVLASRDDRVLKFAYPAGDLTHFFQNLRNPPDFALGFHGPRPSTPDNVYPLQIDLAEPKAKADHGHYLESKHSKPKVLEKCKRAAGFAAQALAGEASPAYRA